MSWVEEVEVPWTIEVLIHIGFGKTEAQRLHRLLPPVTAAVLAAFPTWDNTLYVDGQPNPVATVLWSIHNLDSRAAVRLAYTGRDVLDLIAILDTVHAACSGTQVDGFWSPDKAALATAWATEDRVPADRRTAYIAAGVTPAEAAALEADPATRPTGEQLALLAALRAGGDARR